MRHRLHEPIGDDFVDTVLRPRLLADAAASLSAMLAVNKAHLVMLRERDLIAAPAATRVAAALLELERTGLAPDQLDPRLEDLYANLERAVAAAAGPDAAGRMHVARSRNDLWATVARINARGTLHRVLAALLDLRAHLLALAASHAEVVMPGYTHLQPAQPVTAGFYLAGVEQALARDAERLADAYGRIDRCPLGAAALAGTSFPIDRELTSRLLGFAGPMPNALDAVASRDYVLEVLSGFAMCALTLSRLAEDLYFWSSVAVGLVDFSGAVAVASSIMPQKKNAAALEHLKGRAGQVAGALFAAMTAAKGTHFMHARDTSVEGVLPLAQGEQAITVVLALARAVLDAITFRVEACARRAGDDFTTITDLADLLVREAGLPFRLAHEVCAVLVREALDAGRGPESLTAEAVSAAATARTGEAVVVSEATLRAVLDPETSVRRRTVPGGTAPDAVRAAVAQARQALAHDSGLLDTRARTLEAARAELDRRTARLAAGQV
jgi:argininosuccinate lyase